MQFVAGKKTKKKILFLKIVCCHSNVYDNDLSDIGLTDRSCSTTFELKPMY